MTRVRTMSRDKVKKLASAMGHKLGVWERGALHSLVAASCTHPGCEAFANYVKPGSRHALEKGVEDETALSRKCPVKSNNCPRCGSGDYADCTVADCGRGVKDPLSMHCQDCGYTERA